MPGCKTYRVVPTQCFTSSYRALRDGYYRVGARERSELADIVGAFLATLERNPRPGRSEAEPWPGRQPRSSFAGFDCRKIRFELPGLRGAARLARLIYLVHEPSCSVEVVWLYNHDQFDTRPPDKILKRELGQAIDDARSHLDRGPVLFQLPDGKTAELRFDIREIDGRSNR